MNRPEVVVVPGSEINPKIPGTMFERTSNRRYSGWDNTFDAQFYDRSAFYVCASQPDSVEGIVRIVRPPLPLEQAIGFEALNLDISFAVEISGVGFTSRLGLMAVLSKLYDDLDRSGYKKVLALTDATNRFFYREIGMRGGHLVSDKTVQYKDFKYRNERENVQWSVIEFKDLQKVAHGYWEEIQHLNAYQNWQNPTDYSWLMQNSTLNI
ncbi:MAG: hypothetical protein AAFQ98_23960 [Bacteroidota bacterium]